jgi:hypothetical protein
MKDFDPNTWHSHPVVRSSSTTAECKTNVDRLKAGPANIPEVIAAGTKWTDPDYSANGYLYNNYLQTTTFKSKLETRFADGTLRFGRVGETWSGSGILASNKQPSVLDVNQGGAGTCYFMAALAAVASKPSLMLDTLLT